MRQRRTSCQSEKIIMKLRLSANSVEELGRDMCSSRCMTVVLARG